MASLESKTRLPPPPQRPIAQCILVEKQNLTHMLHRHSIAHPIHQHGHDFWILAQERNAVWDGTASSFQTKNPPRRDTAMLPSNGYLAIAFKLDNPGAWLIHCHIAWHASQGISLEFLESEKGIMISEVSKKEFDNTCKSWSSWSAGAPWPQADSGI